jgi:[ribosomal protein S5]-alanine N-acetyltransferase
LIKPPELFKTDRLLMRLPTLDDSKPLFHEYAQDPEVTKYLTWRPHENLDTTLAFIRRCIQRWQDGTAFPWVITRKQDAAVLGMIEMRIDQFKADLGYGLARRYWGQGYTTEAVKALVQWALDQESIFRVWATCDVDNLASARVMEKAGMQKEGILRRYILHPSISSEPRDCFCYSINKQK